MRNLWVLLLFCCTGCGAGVLVEPGHRGLLFDPKAGGLQPKPLPPAYYALGSCLGASAACKRIDDFDITFSTKREDIHTTSLEGLVMDLRVAVIYKPIETEIYELDTQIGTNYYDEVIGPEFRSASRGVFARHSYLELQRQNEKIEDEIENELRRRTRGKHVEVASVTIEAINYAPEIALAVQKKLVGEQEALRDKAAIENNALKKKLELEHQVEQSKMEAVAALTEKHNERVIAEEQAAIDKIRAEGEAATTITKARADSEGRRLTALADRAEAQALTPLAVMVKAYEALAQLGGKGTTILFGDWAHVPSFLFPPGVGGGGGARAQGEGASDSRTTSSAGR